MTSDESMQHARRRSQNWFDNPDQPVLTVLYLERFMNYGLTRAELQSGKPIIGIAQTGSDISPCNRHHLQLADRTREGIRDAGGIAFEFPVHPIQETCRRPTAAIDRNLAYLGLVEVMHGYPLDGFVLTTGCDKTTPACLMAAATVNLPSIVLSGGPMLNGWYKNKRAGSGTVFLKARREFAEGKIDAQEYWDVVAASTPSVGHCNTMGTASTMNALAETLGMSLPGCSAIPGPHQARAAMAYETGKAIVEMVKADRKPSDIMTRESFENAIRVNSAIGGSTNAPVHLNAIASHLGLELGMDDWQTIGHEIPLILNMQPAGEYLGEDFYRAGGVPAVMYELLQAGLLHEDALTVNGLTIGQNTTKETSDRRVIRPFTDPLAEAAGLLVLRGNLFTSAIMKTSVISTEFRDRYLSDPDDPDAFNGRAVVFDGPEDYAARIEDPLLAISAESILIMRGAGPIGFPGSAEVVNMQPPSYLLANGVTSLPCIGDGRQSGTSGSPSILNASPEAAVLGPLALLVTGDEIRVDLRNQRVDALVDEAEWQRRAEALVASGGYSYPPSQTPWQEIHRTYARQLDEGMVLGLATKYQRVAQNHGLPRFNH